MQFDICESAENEVQKKFQVFKTHKLISTTVYRRSCFVHECVLERLRVRACVRACVLLTVLHWCEATQRWAFPVSTCICWASRAWSRTSRLRGRPIRSPAYCHLCLAPRHWTPPPTGPGGLLCRCSSCGKRPGPWRLRSSGRCLLNFVRNVCPRWTRRCHCPLGRGAWVEHGGSWTEQRPKQHWQEPKA